MDAEIEAEKWSLEVSDEGVVEEAAAAAAEYLEGPNAEVYALSLSPLALALGEVKVASLLWESK